MEEQCIIIRVHVRVCGVKQGRGGRREGEERGRREGEERGRREGEKRGRRENVGRGGGGEGGCGEWGEGDEKGGKEGQRRESWGQGEEGLMCRRENKSVQDSYIPCPLSVGPDDAVSIHWPSKQKSCH